MPFGQCQMTMTAALGHITSCDFANPSMKQWSMSDPLQLFSERVHVFVPPDKKDVVDNISKEARTADYLYIWTDNDMEGEYIGYEVVEAARRGNRSFVVPGSKVLRAVFNNVEPQHVRSAAVMPKQLNMNLVHAVQARIEIDLRIGASLTRFQTMTLRNRVQELKEQSLISYGSCQFPTLGFVVDQYKRLENFQSEPFWSITLEAKMPSSFVEYQRQMTNGSGTKKIKDTLQFKWSRNHIFDRMTTCVLYENCIRATSVRVTKVENKPTTLYRPLPLTTVELTKMCTTHIRGQSAKQILDAAEKLYQQGYISYPRTETDTFDSAINLKGLIRKQSASPDWGHYSKELLGEHGGPATFVTPRKGKHNDQAHPPIHPVAFVSPTVLRSDVERKVYEFVTRRFLACCSKDAKGSKTTVSVTWGNEVFNATGFMVLERNFLDVYPYQRWESSAVQIPRGLFVVGANISVHSSSIKEGKTSPPKLLTESDLIALMDANGIGTDATMADHISTIVEREYIYKQNVSSRRTVTEEEEEGEEETKPKAGGSSQVLIPSALGYGLVEGYDKIGFETSLSKPLLRKETELQMRAICAGHLTKEQVLASTIPKYKELYIQATRNYSHVIMSTQRCLRMATGTSGETEVPNLRSGITPIRRGSSRGARSSRGSSRRRG